MKILCLGAGGFIGSHLTKRLLDEGHTVVAIDIYDDKIAEFIEHERMTFIRQDIRRPDWGLERLVRDSDLVIDLIAYANPGLYVKLPMEVFRLNFTENLKIADACVKYKKRLIQFSTCEVYGRTLVTCANGGIKDPNNPAYATFSEDSSEFILGPVEKHRWIYACAKQLLERVLHAQGLEKGFNYSIIRPFNFIGPKIDYLLDETDGIPRVFSFFMDALINGRQMKLVDGGQQRRCYTYIDDAIECIYRVVENPNGVCDKQIFNVGSPDNEVSIRQLAERMRDIYAEKFADSNLPLPEIVEVSGDEFYGSGYEDSDRRIPDIRKVQKLLGWQPKWGLSEMLEESMKYYVTEYMEIKKRRVEGKFMHDIVRHANAA
ncbi:bifunctional UDP-4-keto-pentose/UDP-xylose synthase [candidate division KSB1 bacterium]|nr:bifunctional UDP-4-keto-pentose/UDP-xylose synthase [candidate division KSB1 bacterium]